MSSSSEVSVGAPNLKDVSPESLAVANFLRHHKELKQRQGIYKGKRYDFFRVKRALRALESPEYKKKAQKAGSHLPVIESRLQALEAFRLLPLNRLAFRVRKLETQEAIKSGQKPASGVPVLDIMQQQEFSNDMYYVWFHEPIQLVTYLYAGLALIGIFAVIMFPLWPVKMRIGVWYLSMGLLGLMCAFFSLAIVRLIVFMITFVCVRPGIWLFPNLFEDVGILESFVPLWSWHGQNVLPKPKKKKKIPGKKINLGLGPNDQIGGGAGGGTNNLSPEAQQRLKQGMQAGTAELAGNPQLQAAFQAKMKQVQMRTEQMYRAIMTQPGFPSDAQQQEALKQLIFKQEAEKARVELLSELQKQQQQQAAGTAAQNQSNDAAVTGQTGSQAEAEGSVEPSSESGPTVQRRTVTLEDVTE